MSTHSTPEEHGIEKVLEEFSKADMLSLIKQMVQLHPDLTGLIEKTQPTAEKSQCIPINPELYRMKVAEIFYTTDRNTWGSEGRAAGPLLDVKDIGDDYVQQHDYDDTNLLQWLKERYQARGNVAGALEMANRTFRAYPLAATIERYREIRQLAQQLGRWETLRSEVMAYLKQSHNTSLQIEIALDEGQIELALALLQSEKQTKNRRKGPYGDDNFDVGIKVAKAAEESHPQESIEIYQRYVETRIEWRGRENYRIVCQYLTSVRKLYQKIGRSDAWTKYIATLREQNRNLPALKDELAKAKL